MNKDILEKVSKHFLQIVKEQLERCEKIKKEKSFIDYSSTKPLIIGIVAGDGIGPVITSQAQKILNVLLAEEITSGKILLKNIEGLTIENRAKEGKAIPDDVLKEIKKCHLILKGPTTTPRKGDSWPNIESANVAMRKELDLFANIRPIKIPSLGIDWTFFRENTEGEYILGSDGINVGEDLAFDFKVATTPGCERIIRLAFEYARKNGKKRVTLVTKANVIKTTDGKFLETGLKIAKEYPEISCDDWYIDIMTAKILDAERRSDFEVIVLPNLYGDIITDEAAELQGGVGTAGSANVGSKYAMFEAIHGSAPRMVQEGRSEYADPTSILRATSLMLRHIGKKEKAQKLENALDKCEKKFIPTGRKDGPSAEEYTNHLVSVSGLES